MTTQALEASLPTLMQNKVYIQNLHQEYLRMHISERMYWPYDYFLRMKVLEHFKKKTEMFGSGTILVIATNKTLLEL